MTDQINSLLGDQPQQVNIPAFTSTGGITPEQQTLADWTMGQGLDANAAQYGGEGIGDSTMATQGAEGVANTKAQSLGQMSDVNQGAMYDLYKNDVQATEQNLQNQITLSNQTSPSLGQLAGLASSGLFGSGTNTSTQTSGS